MTTKDMKRRMEALEKEVKRLKPAHGPNILTSQTSRGVIRRPARNTQFGGGTAPRWA